MRREPDPTMLSLSKAFALLLVFLAPAHSDTRFEAVEPHMGSLVHIVVDATDAPQARRAFAAAFARIAALDAILSDYKSGSELNRLCELRKMRVSDDLFEVLETAQLIARQSHGSFDITAGPLIRLWREARKTGVLPTDSELKAAQVEEHSGLG